MCQRVVSVCWPLALTIAGTVKLKANGYKIDKYVHCLLRTCEITHYLESSQVQDGLKNKPPL